MPPALSAACLRLCLTDQHYTALNSLHVTGVAADSVLASGFVMAAEGESCQATCSGASQTVAFLNNFYTDASTYVCAANINQAWVTGYQTTQPSCAATYNGETVNATSYACLCLTAQQTPGLEPSTGTQSCEQTCAQTLQGQIGTAVKADADLPLYACLPTTEAGIRNRFGTANNQAVSYTPGAVASELSSAAGVEPLDSNSIACSSAAVSSTTDYSCFCTFQPQTASPATVSPATTSSGSGTTSTATAGRKLLL